MLLQVECSINRKCICMRTIINYQLYLIGSSSKLWNICHIFCPVAGFIVFIDDKKTLLVPLFVANIYIILLKSIFENKI